MTNNWLIGFYVVGIPLLIFVLLIASTIRLTQLWIRWQRTIPDDTQGKEKVDEASQPSPLWTEVVLGVAELIVHTLALLSRLGIIKVPWIVAVLLAIVIMYRLLLLLKQGLALLYIVAKKTGNR